MSSVLTAARLRHLFHYDPLTGIFTRLVSRGNAKAGKVAGSQRSNGYIVIRVDDKPYYAHRLAWFYMTGAWPQDQIDHEDTNKANNRFANLRDADNRLNQENQRRAMKNNKLGLLGVSAEGRVFYARICVKGKRTAIGYFKTPEEARAAYVEAKRVLHAGCTL